MNMLRILLTIILLWIGLISFGQPKIVTITVIDKENQIDYEVELKLRTNLTKAINQKQGYMAVDRADIASILNEQSFQQSGMVDLATVKKLGAMTGAKLMLLAEAIKTSNETNIYVAVKLIDVETARIRMTEDITLSLSNIDQGCNSLANKVLGISSTSINNAKPIKLYGYLTIYPYDLGEFTMQPKGVITHLNKTISYGYNNWRLPTEEELSVMNASAMQIPGFKNTRYMTSQQVSYERPTAVRLVSTGESQEEIHKREEEKEKLQLNKLKKEGQGINGVYEVGDYYKVNGKEGIVFSVSSDGRHGKIISLIEEELKYKRTNSWLLSLGLGWRLPTLQELKILYHVRSKVNKGLNEAGSNTLTGNYWSSSKAPGSIAGGQVYILNFTLKGKVTDMLKSIPIKTRAIFSF